MTTEELARALQGLVGDSYQPTDEQRRFIANTVAPRTSAPPRKLFASQGKPLTVDQIKRFRERSTEALHDMDGMLARHVGGPMKHKAQGEWDVSEWTKVRTVCSCGWTGDWRNPHEYEDGSEFAAHLASTRG